MAKIEIEIKDELYSKLVEACAARYNYNGHLPEKTRKLGRNVVDEEKQIAATQEQFLVAVIKQEFLDDVLKSGSIIAAQRNATKAAQEELKDVVL